MIVEALKSLRPGASWELNGETLAWLVWKDEGQPRPTDAEIEAEMTRLAAIPARYQVSKVTILRRLDQVQLAETAIAALKTQPFLYELWSAVPALWNDDPNALSLLTTIGADPAVIMARE